MTQDPKEPENGSPPPNILKIVLAFRQAGWVGFWIQLVLAVISSFILLFAVSSRSGSTGTNNPGTGPGLFLAIVGLVIVYISIFWSFRYTRTSSKLRSNGSDRPSRAQTVRQLKIGLAISLVGMLITLLGAEAIVGVLVAKSVTQPQVGFVSPENFNRTVQPIDIYVVQANTNTILAHFAGLATSLWLLNLTTEKSN